MWIEDLTDCSDALPVPEARLLAVGWLDAAHEYRRGDVARDVFEKLVELLVDPWQPYVSAGFHPCPFCRFTGGPGSVRFADRTVTIGNANLFVPGPDALLIAPSAIVHYIDAHEYLPPKVFLDAVTTCPEMRSVAYLRSLRERHVRGRPRER